MKRWIMPVAAILVVSVGLGIALLLRGKPSATSKSSALVRAQRRAYDGAPPVIPHPPLGVSCTTCHSGQTVHVPEFGTAPPMPHNGTPELGRFQNCRQCHLFKYTEIVFIETEFVGLPQTLAEREPPYPGAPPVIPHRLFLREDCAACHDGPAAREEIRCCHPERIRCTQCHVPAVTGGTFGRE